jgi:hypothetical protein
MLLAIGRKELLENIFYLKSPNILLTMSCIKKAFKMTLILLTFSVSLDKCYLPELHEFINNTT